jgi:hypothetical protein
MPMTLTQTQPTIDLAHFRRDVERIAAAVANDEPTRAELRQEMYFRLLTLPVGRPRRFYLRVLGARAFDYWARNIIDAPLGPTGWPDLDRRTVTVGGLTELDLIYRRQAA